MVSKEVQQERRKEGCAENEKLQELGKQRMGRSFAGFYRAGEGVLGPEGGKWLHQVSGGKEEVIGSKASKEGEPRWWGGGEGKDPV